MHYLSRTRILKGAAFGLLFSLFIASAPAQVTTIDGSPHDLVDGSGQSFGAGSLPGGTGICVFCHTPHGADTSTAVPLWNKDLPDPTTFTQYSTLQTPTLEADELEVGSVSLACLSCHDGVQAMDSVVNVPGSGLGGDETNSSPSNLAGAGTAMVGHDGGSGLPVLGQDLTDDHPIGIQYAGGGCTGADTACTTLTDQDFNTPDFATINTNNIWWVDLSGATAGGASVGTSGSRDKHDLALYTRDNTANGGNASEPFVECGSCHDPHSASTLPVNFMRVDNSDSDLCLGCHVK